MRVLLVLLSVSLLGCFHSIETEPRGPSGPPIPGFDSGPFPDAGPWRRDAGRAPDTGPWIEDAAVADAPFCAGCASEADCPQPALGCARAICVAGNCALQVAPCEGESGCDHDELICAPAFMDVTARIGTDYEPGVEFDRVVMLLDEVVVYHDTTLINDQGRFDLGTVRVGLREEVQLEVVLYLGCEEVVSRRLSAMVFDGSVAVTFIINRDEP